jgi:hypothetical protein
MQQWIIEFCNTGLWWKVVEMKSAAVPKYRRNMIPTIYCIYIHDSKCPTLTLTLINNVM